MKLLFILTIGVLYNVCINAQTVQDFEHGFKYVLDNQDQFAGMTEDQFVTALKKQFNVTSEVRIQTLSEVLQQGNHKWSGDVTRLLTEFNNSIKTSKDFEEFLKGLTIFENGASKLNSDEKVRVLQYIKLVREIMKLIDTDLQFYVYCCDTFDMKSWWDKWGKCVAAIVGGTGTGVIAGAAAGTVPLPGLGTITGAIVGGIFGGLSGASKGC
jgi:hypothetical protein